jgi:hypothetical protein
MDLETALNILQGHHPVDWIHGSLNDDENKGLERNHLQSSEHNSRDTSPIESVKLGQSTSALNAKAKNNKEECKELFGGKDINESDRILKLKTNYKCEEKVIPSVSDHTKTYVQRDKGKMKTNNCDNIVRITNNHQQRQDSRKEPVLKPTIHCFDDVVQNVKTETKYSSHDSHDRKSFMESSIQRKPGETDSEVCNKASSTISEPTRRCSHVDHEAENKVEPYQPRRKSGDHKSNPNHRSNTIPIRDLSHDQNANVSNTDQINTNKIYGPISRRHSCIGNEAKYTVEPYQSHLRRKSGDHQTETYVSGSHMLDYRSNTPQEFDLSHDHNVKPSIIESTNTIRRYRPLSRSCSLVEAKAEAEAKFKVAHYQSQQRRKSGDHQTESYVSGSHTLDYRSSTLQEFDLSHEHNGKASIIESTNTIKRDGSLSRHGSLVEHETKYRVEPCFNQRRRKSGEHQTEPYGSDSLQSTLDHCSKTLCEHDLKQDHNEKTCITESINIIRRNRSVSRQRSLADHETKYKKEPNLSQSRRKRSDHQTESNVSGSIQSTLDDCSKTIPTPDLSHDHNVKASVIVSTNTVKRDGPLSRRNSLSGHETRYKVEPNLSQSRRKSGDHQTESNVSGSIQSTLDDRSKTIPTPDLSHDHNVKASVIVSTNTVKRDGPLSRRNSLSGRETRYKVEPNLSQSRRKSGDHQTESNVSGSIQSTLDDRSKTIPTPDMSQNHNVKASVTESTNTVKRDGPSSRRNSLSGHETRYKVDPYQSHTRRKSGDHQIESCGSKSRGGESLQSTLDHCSKTIRTPDMFQNHNGQTFITESTNTTKRNRSVSRNGSNVDHEPKYKKEPHLIPSQRKNVDHQTESNVKRSIQSPLDDCSRTIPTPDLSHNLNVKASVIESTNTVKRNGSSSRRNSLIGDETKHRVDPHQSYPKKKSGGDHKTESYVSGSLQSTVADCSKAIPTPDLTNDHNVKASIIESTNTVKRDGSSSRHNSRIGYEAKYRLEPHQSRTRRKSGEHPIESYGSESLQSTFDVCSKTIPSPDLSHDHNIKTSITEPTNTTKRNSSVPRHGSLVDHEPKYKAEPNLSQSRRKSSDHQTESNVNGSIQSTLDDCSKTIPTPDLSHDDNRNIEPTVIKRNLPLSRHGSLVDQEVKCKPKPYLSQPRRKSADHPSDSYDNGSFESIRDQRNGYDIRLSGSIQGSLHEMIASPWFSGKSDLENTGESLVNPPFRHGHDLEGGVEGCDKRIRSNCTQHFSTAGSKKKQQHQQLSKEKARYLECNPNQHTEQQKQIFNFVHPAHHQDFKQLGIEVARKKSEVLMNINKQEGHNKPFLVENKGIEKNRRRRNSLSRVMNSLGQARKKCAESSSELLGIGLLGKLNLNEDLNYIDSKKLPSSVRFAGIEERVANSLHHAKIAFDRHEQDVKDTSPN